MGFTLEVLPPDLEHRVAILQTKAKNLGVVLDENILFIIAKTLEALLESLRGFNNVVGQSTMLGVPIDKNLVMDVSSRLVTTLLLIK